MRIIAGEYRGFRLKAPKGKDTRPTTDRVKESIFSIVESKKHISSGADVLDLFAGSGGIGLEFLSRGARSVCFIENDVNGISAIKENIAKCKAESRTEVYKNDVDRALTLLSRKGKKFDYIFMDPPYEKNIIQKVMENIYNNDMLNVDGLVIAEHEFGLELADRFGNIVKVDTRKYGTTGVSFFALEEENE